MQRKHLKLFLTVFFAGLLVSSSIESAIPFFERQALVALYNSTNGIYWANHTNWLQGDPCENHWAGILCNSENTTVRILVLADNNLVGTLPTQLGNLPNLEYLLLQDNQISGLIPLTIGNCTKLFHLFLQNNQLTGAIPTTLCNLTDLYWLKLSNNELSGEIPPELGNLYDIGELELDGNNLSGTIPTEIFNQFTYLGWLDLANNNLEGSIPSEIGMSTNINHLYLESNKLRGSLPTEMQYLANLMGIDIRWNALFTDNQNLKDFINQHQVDGNFESTQTIAPINVSAAATGFAQIKVSWLPIAYTDDAGGYEVYSGLNASGPFTYYDITADKTLDSMIVSGLDPDTEYCFAVKSKTLPHTNNKNTVVSLFSSATCETTNVPALAFSSALLLLILLSFCCREK